jgi:hypothetical protein
MTPTASSALRCALSYRSAERIRAQVVGVGPAADPQADGLDVDDGVPRERIRRMALTPVGSDSLEPPEGTTGCWCCGDRTVQASVVRLGAHREVGVCFRCVGFLARRKRDIQRRTHSAPPNWPLWRRMQYRAGFGRC